MFLNQNQVKELVDIVERFHIMFLAKHVGDDFLTNADKLLLKSSGIDLKKLSKRGGVEAIFRFGMLAEALGHKTAKALNFQRFKKFLAEGKFLPLTSSERSALEVSKMQTYNDVKGLGNRISKDLSQTFIEVDKKQRQKFQKIIKEETEKAILERKTVKELASQLANRTQDWSRDWMRIADYNLHFAFSQGKAEQIAKRYGVQAKVYFEVLPTACPECKKLYLDKLGVPKIFNLSEIINNGSNIGRKQKDWKAVNSPLHPRCRCELYVYDPMYEFNLVTRLFDKPKPYVSPVGRESKVRLFKITQDNELVEI